jgi:hypothetical protein
MDKVVPLEDDWVQIHKTKLDPMITTMTMLLGLLKEMNGHNKCG